MKETELGLSVQEQSISKFLAEYRNNPGDLENTMKILGKMGEYYGADRVYFVEFDAPDGSGVLEWCREGILPQADILSRVQKESHAAWFEENGENGVVFLEEIKEGTKSYEVLNPRGITSIMAASFVMHGRTAGFLGLDNPGRNTDHRLLPAVAASIYSGSIAERQLERSYKETMDRMLIISSMSEIYSSAYYIDVVDDTFRELSSIDLVQKHIGAEGIASDRFRHFALEMMLPEYTEAALEFTDISTLEERLADTKIVSMQYRSSLYFSEDGEPEWRECSFIEGDRDENGRLLHAIFTTQSIQKFKSSELTAYTKLQEANDILTDLLAAEKRHTEVIGALSNVYYAMYSVSLDRNELQDVISNSGMNHVCDRRPDARTALSHIAEKMTSGEHLSIMRVFLDFDTIDERLADEPIIMQEFMDREGDWTRCILIPVDRDKCGKNTKVLCCFRKVTMEREAVESQDNLIQALAIPYENIYVVNGDTGNAVNYRMGQAIEERYGRKFAIGRFETNMTSYIENDVYEEDRGLFDRARYIDGVNELLKDRKAYSFSYRVHRDGRIMYFQCQLVKPNGDRNEFVIAFKNIDEEKNRELEQKRKVEEALAEVENINEALGEQMSVAEALSREYHSLFRIDALTGEMSLYRTDGIGMPTHILEGLTAEGKFEDVLYAYADAFVIPEDRERIKASASLKSLNENVPDVGVYKMGYRRNLAGTIEHYEMNAVKTIDLNGRVFFILGLRDVNEEMQRQLKQAREIEAQSEIIEGLGSEYYSVLLVNPDTDRVTAYRAKKEDGLAIAEHFRKHDGCWSLGLESYARELVSEKSRGEFLKKLSLEYISQDGDDYSITYEKKTARGTVYLQARVSFVHESDGRLAIVIGTRNVDDLIKKERQQEAALQAAYDASEAANKAKTDFLSNMSHDIRTPMNGIIGMTAIAAAHIDDAERVQDCLQKITQASRHLLSLINEVLDMSKIESGKVDLVEEEFNLSELTENLLNMKNAQIEEHRHNLKVNISGVEHEAVIGDSLRIQKVFTNLMSNAVKFTPDGGDIRLSISEKPSGNPKLGCFEFIFEDNGVGMTEGFLERVFEPFARDVDGQAGHIQGTGLGMPISRNIVRMMGGDIKVESKYGEGSRFTVTMYLKLQDNEGTDDERLIDLNVLVADDDMLSLESCCGMLGDLGMSAEGVTNGAEAVEKVIQRRRENRDYFACIIDWKMPEMDGIQTTREIRKAVGKDVPIIIISAYDWSEIELEARVAGVNAFISKPMFKSRLVKTFRGLVGDEDADETRDFTDELGKLGFEGKRALLAEDNELNAEIAKEILEMTGISVDVASDGTGAVDMISECPDGYYDIIFMDIQMPKMNGYDATRAIRSMKRSYCKRVPIIAMTANAFAEDVQAAKTVGMNEHISKPLDIDALMKCLKTWLLQNS